MVTSAPVRPRGRVCSVMLGTLLDGQGPAFWAEAGGDAQQLGVLAGGAEQAHAEAEAAGLVVHGDDELGPSGQAGGSGEPEGAEAELAEFAGAGGTGRRQGGHDGQDDDRVGRGGLVEAGPVVLAGPLVGPLAVGGVGAELLGAVGAGAHVV